jgi:hypothetical protein
MTNRNSSLNERKIQNLPHKQVSLPPGKKWTKIQESFIIYISLGAQERHLSNNIGHVLPVLPDGDEGFLVLVCGQVNSEQVRPALTGHSQNFPQFSISKYC